MRTNEGTVDRVLRVVLGLVAAGVAVAVGVGSVLGVLLLVVGGVLLLTAATGFCPLYRALGMSTCPVPRRH
jgi:uncharacterized membrane protein